MHSNESNEDSDAADNGSTSHFCLLTFESNQDY